MNATGASTKRQRGRPEGRSGEESRARLIANASQLFARHGFESVKLSDVAEASGMTAAAVYNHFGSKDALFIAAVVEVYDHIAAIFDKAADIDGHWHERLNAILVAAAGIYRSDGFFHGIGNAAQCGWSDWLPVPAAAETAGGLANAPAFDDEAVTAKMGMQRNCNANEQLSCQKTRHVLEAL